MKGQASVSGRLKARGPGNLYIRDRSLIIGRGATTWEAGASEVLPLHKREGEREKV